jgi:hypothetical protein
MEGRRAISITPRDISGMIEKNLENFGVEWFLVDTWNL